MIDTSLMILETEWVQLVQMKFNEATTWKTVGSVKGAYKGCRDNQRQATEKTLGWKGGDEIMLPYPLWEGILEGGPAW